MVGPNPKSRLCHQTVPWSSDSALITTPFDWRRRDRAFVSANAGISVVKSRAVPLLFGGVTRVRNRPWIAVPLEVISSTFPVRTWARKKGLNGTRARWTSVARCAAE